MSKEPEKSDTAKPALINVPAVGVSFKTILGDGPKATEIVIQTHVAGDEPKDVLDATLDKFVASLNRQKALADIPLIEESIRKHEEALNNLVEDIERLDTQKAQEWSQNNRSGAPKYNAAEQSNRDNAKVQGDRFKKFIAVEKENLRKANEIANPGNKKSKEAVKAA